MAKRRVAEKNVTYRLRDVEALTIETFNQITKDDWQRCIAHVKKVEERYMQVRLCFNVINCPSTNDLGMPFNVL